MSEHDDEGDADHEGWPKLLGIMTGEPRRGDFIITMTENGPPQLQSEVADEVRIEDVNMLLDFIWETLDLGGRLAAPSMEEFMASLESKPPPEDNIANLHRRFQAAALKQLTLMINLAADPESLDAVITTYLGLPSPAEDDLDGD